MQQVTPTIIAMNCCDLNYINFMALAKVAKENHLHNIVATQYNFVMQLAYTNIQCHVLLYNM